MAKSIAKSCPLCLTVNDPVDMLPVTMKHSTPPQTAPLYLCRLCLIQIMKSTLQTDLVDPSEVLGNVEPGNPSTRGGASDLDDSSGIPAVGDDQAHSAGTRATEVAPAGDDAAGGQDSDRDDEG